MMLSAKEIEQAQYERVRQQMRDQERARFADPDREQELEGVWVAYIWAPDNGVPDKGEWLPAGFRRKRNKRKPQTMGRFFSKVRRQMNIDKKSPVLLMDLTEATRRIRGDDQSWRFRAPAFQERKATMEQRTPKPVGKTTKRRATVRAKLLNKKTTKYLAIGRNPWDRKPGYLYLGPLSSDKKRSAQFEAKRMFPVFKELLVLGISELSKPMRNAMARSKRVKAGFTRIAWPEVPPTFDMMWTRFVKRLVRKEFHSAIAMDDVRLVDIELALQSAWELQDRPWLSLSWFRKQIKPWRLECDPKPKGKRKSRQRRSGNSSVALASRGTRSRKRNASGSAKSTKRGATTSRRRTGFTNSRKVRESPVTRIVAVLRKISGKTSAHSSKRASNGRSASKPSRRTKTNGSSKRYAPR